MVPFSRAASVFPLLPALDRFPRLGLSRRFLRTVACVLILTMLNMALLPLAHALELRRNQPVALQAGAGERYAEALARLKAGLAQGASGRVSLFRSGTVAPDELNALQGELEAEWAALGARWQAAGVAPSVLQRQQQLEARFRQQHQALIEHLNQAGTPDGRTALARFVSDQVPERTHHPVDLDNLPWQVQQYEARPPLKTVAELEAALGGGVLAKRSQATLNLSTTSNDVNLAPTADAPHTEAIKALAVQLGKNPHKIFQWVHDNIQFHPSYGSVQGAQDTLDKKSGNAYDTANLLVALLRSAQIPARYRYAVVDIPADKVMNWVGGVSVPEAASQLLGQGGIPHAMITQGGKVQFFRMEQIWVEAWIQFYPHRGARHIGGVTKGDTWVPMDASFKQYTLTEAMDLEHEVPFDVAALQAAIQQDMIVNEAEGWVQQRTDHHAVQQHLRTYQEQLQGYIQTHTDENSTVADVLGSQRIRPDRLPFLAGSLPYTVYSKTAPFSQIPATLQHQFRYRIYTNDYAHQLDDTPILNFQAPTATLAGKKVTLLWVAADEANQKAIEALLPTPQPGQSLKPEDLPRRLPASIQLKAQLLVEGEVKAESSPLGAGSEPIGAGAFTRYSSPGQWDETTDQLIAGQQSALGLSIQGISKAQLTTLKNRMATTRDKFQEAENVPIDQRPAILQGLTPDSLTGDMLISTIWGFFNNVQTQQILLNINKNNMVDLPGLSYGLFHAAADPNKLYGIVTTGVTFKGFNMDVGHMRYIRWSKTNDKNAWISYNRVRGQDTSAQEHLTPEQFWVDRAQCRYIDENDGQVKNPHLQPCDEAVSAVKALAIARVQGQKIFTITSKNASSALARLGLRNGIGEEVRIAVAMGKEVTIHEKPINAYGWNVYGYTIIDPETGAGAYLIEGKGNGSLLKAKLELFIGSWLWFQSQYPVMAKAIKSVLAFPIASILTTIDLIKNCKSLEFAIAAAIIFTIFNIMTMLLAILFVASTGGLGLAGSATLFIAEALIEAELKKLVKQTPLCTNG